MKRTLLMSLLGFSMAAQAQHSLFKLADPKTTKGKHLAALLSQQAEPTAAKTTGIHQRVTSVVNYYAGNSTNLLTAMDSTSYNYTGYNGSVYDYNQFAYIDADEAPSVKYHERVYSDNWGTVMTIEEKNIAHYNAAGKPDTNLAMTPDFTNTVFEDYNRYRYVYNTQGKLQTKFIDEWDDTQNMYVPYEKKMCFYNTAGLLTSDTTYYVDTTYGYYYDIVNVYTYNAAGKELSRYNFAYDNYNNTGWDTAYSNVSNYYSSNYLKTSRYTQYYTGGSYTTVDSFGYGTGSLYNYHAIYDVDYMTQSLTKEGELFMHFTSAGLPDTISYIDLSSFPNTDSFKYIYYINSYGNPDSLVSYPIVGGVIQKNNVDAKILFHYDTYNDLAVADIKKENSILLFPNPANDAISIRRDYTFGNKETAIVWNTAGQKLIEQGLGSNKTANILVNNLTPGMYWVAVQDEKGNIVSRQSFVKK